MTFCRDSVSVLYLSIFIGMCLVKRGAAKAMLTLRKGWKGLADVPLIPDRLALMFSAGLLLPYSTPEVAASMSKVRLPQDTDFMTHTLIKGIFCGLPQDTDFMTHTLIKGIFCGVMDQHDVFQKQNNFSKLLLIIINRSQEACSMNSLMTLSPTWSSPLPVSAESAQF